MIDPIVVVGMGRSGTSLVAGLLDVHGVWVGTKLHSPSELNPRGDYVNKAFGNILSGDFSPNGLRRVIESELKEQDYQGGPWLIKHAPKKSYCVAWQEAYNPLWVCVRRDLDSVFESKNNIARWKDRGNIHEKDTFVKRYDIMNAYMDKLRDENGFDIWPHKIIKGYYTEFKVLCSNIGLKFSEEKTKEFIMPDKWRY